MDGPTGASFVLVRAGEVGVVDRRDPGGRLLLDAAAPDDRAAAFATRTQHADPATPENVPPTFRDLLLQPEGATDWAVYYPPILLGTDVADPSRARGGGDCSAAVIRRAPSGCWRRRRFAGAGRGCGRLGPSSGRGGVAQRCATGGVAWPTRRSRSTRGSEQRMSRGAMRCRRRASSTPPRRRQDRGRGGTRRRLCLGAPGRARAHDRRPTRGRGGGGPVADDRRNGARAVDRGLRRARRQPVRRRRGRLPNERS